jgi:hypothetical protein
MTPSDGSIANGPQVSAAERHSADTPHSWSWPNIVVGHGPAWQLEVMLTAPQHTWPGRHAAEVLHVMALVGPPPLLLPLPMDPLSPSPDPMTSLKS